jgi:hypothetical protein
VDKCLSAGDLALDMYEHEIKWERYRKDVSTIAGSLVCKWTADIPVASTKNFCRMCTS